MGSYVHMVEHIEEDYRRISQGTKLKPVLFAFKCIEKLCCSAGVSLLDIVVIVLELMTERELL